MDHLPRHTTGVPTGVGNEMFGEGHGMSHHEIHPSTDRSATAADGNAVVTRAVDASPQAVWAVLANGWLYPSWVVGASRVRAVEQDWPQEGSRIHHSFGIWPALIDDHTEVLDCDPGRELLLKARGWPAGEARVRILVTQGDTPGGSVVSIIEDVTDGPGRIVPRPARQMLITPRNVEALRRLAYLAESRTQPD